MSSPCTDSRSLRAASRLHQDTSRRLVEEARHLCEMAAELCHETRLASARARATREASRDLAGSRHPRPAFIPSLRDEPSHPAIRELEEALGLPWCEVMRVTDTLAEAFHLANQGQLEAGYRCLAEPARRVLAAHNPEIAAQVSQVRLWEKALSNYYALYRVDC